ncbi:MAG: tRNA uridine-5-carboxymethylaminomethyl(34) synthesis enzyme MnmG [Bacteroidales bacterium]|nr:tRNA uridine-5-carboxymethylaminomethyl(34) synthesis enzyme MnmG [Bacteroidales bacterium]HNW72696.1 tRNA uridine-5-carboxymethylaminomethyl(34) synthesis enzyme MnmG [Bacteroidales bacterium]HPS49232.1 tRNA uridine-5-carboxymethylaminomethyl(34) synthesis enzyme MnmG [Bacteroidales bacterium]
MDRYEIIVIGAGHAGCEAAMAAANLGSTVLLITMNMSNMAQMSCNPSIGGVAKGQIIREIDALGGYSGIVSDRSMIQFRMLNKSKGPAMWSPRSQNDRYLFSSEWRKFLENNKRIFFWQDFVEEILIVQGRVIGVKTGLGMSFQCKSVILSTGTFLNGIIHIGEKSFSGGRLGERAARFLTEQLVKIGFESKRMKTGTPVRVDGRTLDFSKMEKQPGDENPGKFSFTDTSTLKTQKDCFLTYTSKKVHEVLRSGFKKSPLFSGRIKGKGPRYCPSIEDKIERFASKDSHQLFIEPEGWETVEYYVNGFSSSLPEDVQFKALRLIPGFKDAKFFRPGYAIEYDYFPPDQLSSTLETKLIKNLFFAGQINGTTGYEEAAAQGLVAGINAHQSINEKEPFSLQRSDAYIGVLIDDLITKGTEEPYRMFTSRAEFRILLRQDNADERLTPVGYTLGLISNDRFLKTQNKYNQVNMLINFLQKSSVSPEIVNQYLISVGSKEILQKQRISSILLRPNITLTGLIANLDLLSNYIKINKEIDREIIEEAELKIKYQSYILKEQELALKMIALENQKIPENFDYHRLNSISSEAREKLSKLKPATVGQAGRISGVSPSDISVLIVYLNY